MCLSQGEFSTWYVQFLPASFCSAARPQTWKLQLICGGGSLVLVTKEEQGALRGSDLLQAECE